VLLLGDAETRAAYGIGRGRTRHPQRGAVEQPWVAIWQPLKARQLRETPLIGVPTGEPVESEGSRRNGRRGALTRGTLRSVIRKGSPLRSARLQRR
jgi:hypothetical protein